MPETHPHALPGLDALEMASARLWPAAEICARHGWILRAGGARSRRLNSVQTLAFAADADVVAAVAAAESWYQARDLPPCFQITTATRPAELDAVLAARGYRQLTPTSVMLADAAAVAGTATVVPTLMETPSPAAIEALSDAAWNEALRLQRAALFARITHPHRFALIDVDGNAAAGGLCVVDGPLGAIFSMRTQPRFRRRGLARATLLALAAWARDGGARWLFLQVEDDNPAQQLYRDLGFIRRHGYHYRELAALP